MERDTLISPFYLDETPTMPGKYILRIHHEQFHCTSTIGSYNVLGARLLNISFANYLRLLRDEYGAELYGKNSAYPVAYFDKNNKSELLVKTLNELANLVEWERNNPEVIQWAAAHEGE